MNAAMLIDSSSYTLLNLLQLASPTLPVGAYSYSEGIETLVNNGTISDWQSLWHWLDAQLRYGAIRLDAAVMVRGYNAALVGDRAALSYWNNWLSATWETEELRQQSWQMGRSLMQLFEQLQPQIKVLADAVGKSSNYAIAFGAAANVWKIDISSALLGYLHSWATNLIAAGIKLIPLGQTSGQLLLNKLNARIYTASQEILGLEDNDLSCCSWGKAMASMAHETQYTRLFRS